MIKLWAYLVAKENDKIMRETVFVADGKYDQNKLFAYLTDICAALDVPVPIILGKHATHLTQFNTTRFKASDFVETVPFKFLTLEFIPEKK